MMFFARFSLIELVGNYDTHWTIGNMILLPLPKGQWRWCRSLRNFRRQPLEGGIAANTQRLQFCAIWPEVCFIKLKFIMFSIFCINLAHVLTGFDMPWYSSLLLLHFSGLYCVRSILVLQRRRNSMWLSITTSRAKQTHFCSKYVF